MRKTLLVRLLRLVPGPMLRLAEGFWLVPVLWALIGLGLAVAVHLFPEDAVPDAVMELLARFDIEGARAALSTMVGGLVSLVAMVFSLTFVALSITAQQLSPRVLDFVLRTGSAKMLLGVALAAILLGIVQLSIGDGHGAWRLFASLPLVVLLTMATLVLVVVFAHRMTRVVRAEDMVAFIGARFVSSAATLGNPPAGCSTAEPPPDLSDGAFETGTVIHSGQAGYVTLIDYADLVALADRRGLQIDLVARESAFLLPRVAVARVLGLHQDEEDLDLRIQDALNLSDRRELHDTAGFEASALSEGALRALSPGINDPATAISCLNRLFEGFAVIAQAPEPPRWLAPEGSAVACLRRPYRGVPEFLLNTVRPVIAAAGDDAQVRERIRTLCSQLRDLSTRPRDRDAISAMISDLGRAESG